MSTRITTHYNIDPIATAERIENIFKHHPPFGDQPERYNLLRENAKAFAYLIISLTPKSAEQERALSHLDEVVASANMAIARHEKQPDPHEVQRLIATYGDPAFAGRYGGHDPNELPGLEESEHAGVDPLPKGDFSIIPKKNREPNVIPA